MSGKENRKQAFKKLKLLAYNSKCEINSFRKKLEDAFYSPFLPNHVENNEHDYGCVACDVLVPEIYSSKRVVLYIHGGCFVGGSRASYRSFCSILANRSYSRVIVPEYRLAPSHVFPAAIEDVQSVFRALFTEEQVARSLDTTSSDGLKIDESQNQPEIIVAADGAGASIAMALLLNLRDRYRKCIKHIVFFSPWLNLSDKSPIKSGKKVSDGIISGEVLQRASESYTYSSNFENPLVSPIFAAKELLSDFPPVFMQMGGDEILLEDAMRFEALLKEAGVDCELDVWQGMMHNFQMADEFLDEAHSALDKFAETVSASDCTVKGGERFENKPKLEFSLNSEA